MVGSYSEILKKVERKEAVVMTAQEVSMLVELGESSRLSEVDIVTSATRAVMSGTYAVLFSRVRAGIVSASQEGMDQRHSRTGGTLSQREPGYPGFDGPGHGP